jgi:hypothetical protein
MYKENGQEIEEKGKSEIRKETVSKDLKLRTSGQESFIPAYFQQQYRYLI